jgi:hypothetical protein
MRRSPWLLAGALALPWFGSAAAQPEVSPSAPGQVAWARWQGRLSLVTVGDPWRLGVENGSRLQSASLMSDYYFGRSLKTPGGMRATGGLVFGPRYAPSTGQPSLASAGGIGLSQRTAGRAGLALPGDGSTETTTTPYLGVGYTGLWERSRWSFSADLGLLAQNTASAGRLGRAGLGNASLDDTIRDMRMTPLFQLGVSYSF